MLTQFESPQTIFLDEVDSTNNYVAKLVRDGHSRGVTIVSADFQSEGRGQRATKWQSFKAQNALFSIYLPWKYLHIEEHFVVSMMAALSTVEVLEALVSDPVYIKWPNDIYVNQAKIGGILIESDLSGSQVTSSIVGIGLNVNQTQFESNILATSLKLETGQHHDRQGLIQSISERMISLCRRLENEPDKFLAIKKEYLSRLYGFEKFTRVFSNVTSEHITIKPLDISRTGELLALVLGAGLSAFDIKEIVWNIGVEQ